MVARRKGFIKKMRTPYKTIPNNASQQDVLNWVIDVTRERQFDLDDYDIQVSSNPKIYPEPSSSSDIIGTEKVGDIAVGASSLYVVVDNAGTLEWLTVAGSTGGLGEEFETVSKNLKSYPYTLNYTAGVLTSIVYTLPSGSITKTLNYTAGLLTSVVLSGDTPSGIDLTKTLSYTGSDLTGVVYS